VIGELQELASIRDDFNWTGVVGFSRRTLVLRPFLAFFLLSRAVAQAQPAPSLDTIQVPLLRVYLTHRLRMREGEAVQAKLIEPAYAFDRIVVPSGVELRGHIATLQRASKMVRAQAMLQGDFSPLHWGRVEFTDVLMPDGKLIPIETVDTLGLPTLYVPPRPSKAKPKSAPAKRRRLGAARQQAKQQIDAKTQGVIDLVRGPNKKEWLEDFLIVKLPYHPRWYRRNTRFDAVLGKPLEFGNASVPSQTLRSVGLPNIESIAHVRLIGAVSSADATTNTKVEGVLSQPIFSADKKLLLPEGTRLTGLVRHAQPARWFHKGGQLRFTFDHVEPPPLTAVSPLLLQRMEAQLTGVEADPRTRVDSEGNAKPTEPKSRLLGPVITLIVATHSSPSLKQGGHCSRILWAGLVCVFNRHFARQRSRVPEECGTGDPVWLSFS
jgi:hypothetical protein